MSKSDDLEDSAPASSGHLSELLAASEGFDLQAEQAKLRAEQAEILEFLFEAIVKTEGPKAVSLPSNEVLLINDAKTAVNDAVRSIDDLMDNISSLGLRNTLLSSVNDALLYAFIVGNYSQPTESIWKLHGRQHLHVHTKPASNARKTAGGINELLEKLAKNLWSRKPTYKGNPTGTAKEIQSDFNQETASWKKTPKKWEPADSENPGSVKKEIERIRKRIAKMTVTDNRRSSS